MKVNVHNVYLYLWLHLDAGLRTLTVTQWAAWWRVGELHRYASTPGTAAVIGCRRSRVYSEDGVSKWR